MEITQPEKKKLGILMNTISLKGILAIAMIFILITGAITIIAIISPKPYIQTKVGLWECSQSTQTFNPNICK
ncbi:hypothetical protein ENUP19_0328G0055, partial [Entamoeba nuttalli]